MRVEALLLLVLSTAVHASPVTTSVPGNDICAFVSPIQMFPPAATAASSFCSDILSIRTRTVRPTVVVGVGGGVAVTQRVITAPTRTSAQTVIGYTGLTSTATEVVVQTNTITVTVTPICPATPEPTEFEGPIESQGDSSETVEPAVNEVVNGKRSPNPVPQVFGGLPLAGIKEGCSCLSLTAPTVTRGTPITKTLPNVPATTMTITTTVTPIYTRVTYSYLTIIDDVTVTSTGQSVVETVSETLPCTGARK